LFALGCVLYTVLTGELPFQGESAMAVMVALANKTPEPVDKKNPAVPRAVVELITQLLEKDPASRPQTAAEVAARLDAALAALTGPAPLTTPPPAGAQLHGAETMAPGKSDTQLTTRPTHAAPGGFAKRRRAAVAGALVALVAVAAFVGWRLSR